MLHLVDQTVSDDQQKSPINEKRTDQENYSQRNTDVKITTRWKKQCSVLSVGKVIIVT